MKKHIAVLVTSHGEVDTPSFRAYYDNMKHIFAHVSEIMPIPRLAQWLIPPIGAAIQALKSKKVGYLSPMNRISTRQAEKISEKLQQLSHDFKFSVFNTFETTPPYTHDLLHALLHAEHDYDGVIALVMNPMESAFSCGAICRFALKELGAKAYSRVRVVTGLYKNEALMRLYADHIFSHVQPSSEKSGLIIALHGTVVSDSKGNPVPFHNGLMENQMLFSCLKQTIELDSRNPFNRIEPAYLNHQVGGKWTEPTLSQTITLLKKSGIAHAYLFAAGYFADNSETHGNAQSQLKQSGFKTAHYIPCINDSDAFADLMAKEIVSATKRLVARGKLLEET